MSASRKAWIVAASIGAVEAMKDQGFCRWNYPLKSLLRHAKTNLKSYCQAQRLSGSSSSSSSSSSASASMICNKVREEKWMKVMELNCWGPTTTRF
ncbi:hypothetical protein U1Q18_000593 [Sarracenia purpurea var. burkii]